MTKWIELKTCELLGKRILLVKPYIKYHFGRLVHFNLGDDLNVSFLSKITSYHVLDVQTRAVRSCDNRVNKLPIYFIIGSCFHFISDTNSVVWGAGLLTDKHLPKVKPGSILAVRGPLTRKVLIENGIDCPEVYGDPALLLPYYYPFEKRRKYKMGIIPHYVDFYKEELDKFKDDDSVLIIQMSGYRSWKNVIKQICSCEYIASSSLHGLIIAEAYGIPNLWIEIREPLVGDIRRRFKFHDFFLSRGYDVEEPYTLDKNTTINDLLGEILANKNESSFSILPLVQSCPFPLRRPYTPFL